MSEHDDAETPEPSEPPAAGLPTAETAALPSAEPRAASVAARQGVGVVRGVVDGVDDRVGQQAAGEGAASCVRFAAAAGLAHELGLGVNAGHDLDLDNLALFRGLPHLDEVSIGHALISRALFVGLDTVVREYLDVLARA